MEDYLDNNKENFDEHQFYGEKDLVGFKYTYQFSKILSTKSITLSSRITKLGGVN